MKTVVKILLVILILAIAIWATIIALNNTNGSNEGTSTVTRGVVINEVMASNGGIFPDNNGNYSDWIELYNGTGQDVDLSRLALSDDENTPIKWGFEAGTLKADGYLVVFMSGKSGKTDIASGIYHASFKLSSSKETLILSNIDGEVLDKQSWESMDKNVSQGRNENSWQVLTNPTPGFPNTDEGLTQFKASRTIQNPQVLITEVMGSNNTTVKDNTGAYSDYIEVTNVSDKNVNLYGMGLSDDEADPMQWRFPNVSIAPGEQFVVWCSGDPDLSDSNPKKGTHANFRISTYKETIVLSESDGKTLDKTSITELTADASWAREYSGDSPSGTFKISYKPTPGYPNTDAGYTQFSSKNKLAVSDIYISEILTSNTKKDFEGDGNYYDYIEIYNGSGKTVNLADYSLTNNTSNPAKWKFPNISLSAGEYKVVLASGLSATASANKKYLHTTFKTSNEGDIVALYDPDGKLLDRYNMGYNPTDVSCGRKNADDVSLYFYTDVTPGNANGEGALGFTEKPTFTLPGGIYTGTQKVEIKAPSGATIYYTTDNSTPTMNSTVYSGPITVSQTTIIRAVAKQKGYLSSYSSTASYLMNISHSLPIISIVTDDSNLWGSKGMYDWGDQVTEEYKNDINNFPYKKANFQQKWERPGSIEVIKNGKSVLSQNIGLRISGDYSRALNQKSFAVFGRSEYGESTINYPFIDNLPYTEYKSIVLRNGGNDGTMAKMRDIVTTSIVKDNTNLDIAGYQTYVAYLNGEYWGTYHVREKVNKYLVAQHNGLSDPDNIDLLVGTGTALVGSNADYKKMITFMENNSLADQKNFDYIASQMDVYNFMDYIICEIWSSNSDTGNIKYWRDKSGTTDGKWRWIFYDLDWALWPTYVDSDRVARQMDPGGHGVGSMYPTTIFRSLLKNEKWKDAFVERFAYHLKNTFTPTKVISRIDEIYNSMKDEMTAERAKFGGTVANWDSHVGKLRDFAKNRNKYVVQHLKNDLSLTTDQIKMLNDSINYG